MKLSAAALTSILLVCSVTVASPVTPSTTASTEHSLSTTLSTATTSTEYSHSTTPPTDAINIRYISMQVVDPDATHTFELDTFTVENQNLIRNYCKRYILYIKAMEIRDSKRDMVTTQERYVAQLRVEYQQLIRRFYKKSNGSKYKSALDDLRIELENLNSELVSLEKQKYMLESEYDTALSRMRRVERKIALLFFERFTRALTVRFHVNFGLSSITISLGYELYELITRQSTEFAIESANEIQSSSQQEVQNLPPSYESAMQNHEQHEVDSEDSENQPPSYDEVLDNPENFPKILENSDIATLSAEPLTEEPSSEETHIPIAQPVRETSSLGWLFQYVENLLNLKVRQPRRDDPPN
ncbi:hypothetical protein MT418_007485 [Batrachochytrium dendrobatidis]